MTGRRHFLKHGAVALGGIVMVGCGVLDVARATTAPAPAAPWLTAMRLPCGCPTCCAAKSHRMRAVRC